MNSKRIAHYALLIALAMVLSWLESLIPVSSAVPGVKLGLTNLVVLFALYRMGPWDALSMSLIRVVLVSLTFGNAFAFAYSFAGAALSFLIMWALKKSGKFSTVGVSVAGGVGHNIGQILVASVVLDSGGIFYYLPILLISGILAGVGIGLAGAVLIERLPKSFLSK